VGPFPGAGAAGDGSLTTAMAVAPNASLTFTLAEPRRVDAITLVAAAPGPALPRSLDLEISADGRTFTLLSQRRAREERFDLRWVNGHPQYVTESDLLSVPLPERTLAALRVSATGGASGAIGEVLLHPPGGAGPLATWPEWLAPGLPWPQLRERLVAEPHPDRADWYFRMLLVSRH
jgi:hypothetical protein